MSIIVSVRVVELTNLLKTQSLSVRSGFLHAWKYWNVRPDFGDRLTDDD